MESLVWTGNVGSCNTALQLRPKMESCPVQLEEWYIGPSANPHHQALLFEEELSRMDLEMRRERITEYAWSLCPDHHHSNIRFTCLVFCVLIMLTGVFLYIHGYLTEEVLVLGFIFSCFIFSLYMFLTHFALGCIRNCFESILVGT